MNILKTGFTGILSGVMLSGIIENIMTNYDTDIQPPPSSVSIIMPAYNEEMFIEKSASSIRYQSLLIRYPEYFEFILADNGSTDDTPNLAKAFVDKVIFTPKGKLTARNIATRLATGNIIVSVDADIYYPYYWLNTLLKPFQDPQVVAISGTILDYSIPGIPGPMRSFIGGFYKLAHSTKIYGGNGAYYKDAFHAVGGFDENINQFDIKQMLEEEETKFGTKLTRLGKVVLKFNACCIHLGGQKIACRIGTSHKNCEQHKFGIERFDFKI